MQAEGEDDQVEAVGGETDGEELGKLGRDAVGGAKRPAAVQVVVGDDRDDEAEGVSEVLGGVVADAVSRVPDQQCQVEHCQVDEDATAADDGELDELSHVCAQGLRVCTYC